MSLVEKLGRALGLILLGLSFLSTHPSLEAGCNLNGQLDEEDIASGISDDCNENEIPDECELLPAEFGLVSGRLAVPPNALAMTVADIDGNGVNDIAVARKASNLISKVFIYLNSGDVVPEELNFAEHVLDAKTKLADITVADLDGDGDLDLATTHSNFVLVFRNTTNGGAELSFEAPVEISVTSGHRALTAGDIDGDNLSDLILTSSLGGRVTILQNQGDAAYIQKASFPIGSTPVGTRLADLDGDSDTDLAFAVNDGLRVYLNDGFSETAENAGFRLSDTLLLTENPSALAAADVYGDGSIDLVVAGERNFQIFRNDGSGQFVSSLSSRNRATDVKVTDIDADGDADILLLDAASELLPVVENLGDDRFTVSARLSIGLSNALGFGIADIDRNGGEDIVILGRSGLGFLWSGISGSLDLDVSTLPVDVPPHSIVIRDFNLDGQLDGASTNGNPTYSVYAGNGTTRLGFPVTTTLPLFNGNAENLNHLTSADFNGDGADDIAMADNGNGLFVVLLNRLEEPGTFEEPVFYSAAAGTFMIQSGDFNADGSPDLTTADRGGNRVTVALNDGAGGFDARVSYVAGSAPRALAIADFDRDGDLDIVSADENSGSATLLANDGEGAFGARGQLPVTGSPVFVNAADYDGDGSIDIAVTNASSISVFLNKNNSAPLGLDLFGPEAQYFVSGNYSMLSADISGDGVLDLVTTSQTLHRIAVVLGRGDGSFGSVSSFQTGRGPRFTAAADLDRDGDLDLVNPDRQGNTMTYIENGALSKDGVDFLRTVCTELDFKKISVSARLDPLVDRASKFTLPARDDPELLETVYQNVQRINLHQDFLEEFFPAEFGSLSFDEYNDLVGRRETRNYYVGVMKRMLLSGQVVYGFTVLVDDSDVGELLTQEEVEWVYDSLRESFLLEPLGYAPEKTLTRELAESWVNPPFPVYLDSGPSVPFQPYTQGEAYGTVRVLNREEFEAANDSGQISFQSILVLDFAPRDIEGVVSGLITSEPQGELSHPVILLARRNTPNAFDSLAIENFTPHKDKLVRIVVGNTGIDIQEANIDDAQDFWAENRPSLTVTPTFDADFGELTSLSEIADLLKDEDARLVPRYGGKATGLSRLRGILGNPEWSEYQESGFAIPMRHYLEFMQSTDNSIASAIDPARSLSYAAYLEEVFADPTFQADSEFRFRTLQNLRDDMRAEGIVDPALVTAIAARVREVLETPPNTRVRFRSSSNVEDSLEFNGAGLYNSTSGCIEDDTDTDAMGPSICDPIGQENERGVTRALKRVWASLWNFRAFEERSFFGVEPDLATMGILVNRTFIDEAANGVAFTGDLFNPLDRRYFITVQPGEESVVSPEPGVRAERVRLRVEDGEVKEIARQSFSSLLEPGQVVLSNAQLTELGELMWHIDQNYPLELGDHDRKEVLLDLEFKFMPDGELAVKQVRPFLLTVPAPPTPSFEMEIPAGLEVCGVFAERGGSRGPLEEYQFKSRLRFHGGTIALTTDSDSFPADLFDEVLMGPERERASATGEGRIRVSRRLRAGDITTYRFTYSQTHRLSDGSEVSVQLTRPIIFEAIGEEPIGIPRVVLDEAFFTRAPGEETFQVLVDQAPAVAYGSCELSTLPLVETRAVLSDGTSLNFIERFDGDRNQLFTSPVILLRGEARFIDGSGLAVNDYWRLVYSARQHNKGAQYWIVADSPFEVPGVDGQVRAVELIFDDLNRPQEAMGLRGAYLDQDFEVLATREVSSLTRGEGVEPRFIRGDANGNGRVELADASFVLNFLFLRGATADCRKSADANDDGRVNIIDASTLLSHLFRDASAPLPEPATDCGADPSADRLSCEDSPACP